ncbi:MAG: TRAP transporter permease [Deltaproteobacteria bacterium]|nr:MAG: TRAP transporter permease [Deltaproteobacteria bacterium]
MTPLFLSNDDLKEDLLRGEDREEIREIEDSGEVTTAFRELAGGWKWMVYVIGIAASIFHIWVNTIGVMPAIYRNAVHLGFIMVLAFFFYPMFKRAPHRGFRIDLFLALLACIVTLYILFFEEELHLERASVPIMRDYIFAAIAIVILLVGTQRAAGWIIPALSIIFLAYALFLGKYIPGAFHYRGVALGRLLYRMYLTDEGMFGIVCTVSSTYVYLFILFGAFLLKSGAGDFIIKLAQALTGRRVGGPAKIAVVSSGFMGSVSGSAVANTVATGSFTIPLMKRMGYRPHFAGGVEAAASTGGQLMPPIMGAGAFIMAQWTGIPYLKIIAVSVIPAIMYFLSVGFFVHIEALKLGMKPLSKEEIPNLKKVLKKGANFLIPVMLLVLLLIRGFTPTYAACVGILSIIVVSWFHKETRMGFVDIMDALYIGARNSVSTAAILICAGIIIGIVGITGVGVTFSGMVVDLSGGHLFWAIVLVMLASLVLGMGLPVTASYIFLAVLAAPALKQLGVSLLAAHMIIFWYSQDANVTPPVCLAAYSASGIAGSKPMETGLAAWKLAKGLYIIPFLFAYTPLLFEGPLHEVLITAISATLGLFAFTVAMEGYLLRKLFFWERGLVVLATIGLLWPHTTFRVLGFLIFGFIYMIQKMAASRHALRPVE